MGVWGRRVCWLGLLALQAVAATDVEEEDDVAVLTTANFDAWVEAQPLALVEFYAPWCGHCKSLAPEWAAAAAELKKTNPPPALLAKVDATQEESLASKFGVEGYPTIYIFRNGVKEGTYDGPREQAGIVAWVEEQGPPTFEVINTVPEAQAFVKANQVSVVAVLRPPLDSSKIMSAVKALSKEMHTQVSFAVESNAQWDVKASKYLASEVGVHLGVEMGAVVFLDHGNQRMPCKIVAKKYSKKTLKKCINEALDARKAIEQAMREL